MSIFIEELESMLRKIQGLLKKLKYIAIITLHELDIRRTTSHIQDVR